MDALPILSNNSDLLLDTHIEKVLIKHAYTQPAYNLRNLPIYTPEPDWRAVSSHSE